MLQVGLTGGIASGKSLVARIFRDLGAHLIDADRIVHEFLEPGQPAYTEILHHFGRDIQLPDGRIDRRVLGQIVFQDRDKLLWLNQCLHPRVFEAYRLMISHLRERQEEIIVVFDAALLIETGFHRKMDRVVVVYAELDQQLERLALRDGFTKEQALSRIRSQMPLDEKRGQADYVIVNTGTREQAEHQAREIYVKLNRVAEKPE